jgi:hypothetical protein
MKDFVKKYWWLLLLLLLLWWWWKRRKVPQSTGGGTDTGYAERMSAFMAAAAAPVATSEAPPAVAPAGWGYSGPTANIAAGYISAADFLAASPEVIFYLNGTHYFHPTQGDMGVELYQAFLNIKQNGSDTADVVRQMSDRMKEFGGY